MIIYLKIIFLVFVFTCLSLAPLVALCASETPRLQASCCQCASSTASQDDKSSCSAEATCFCVSTFPYTNLMGASCRLTHWWRVVLCTQVFHNYQDALATKKTLQVFHPPRV